MSYDLITVDGVNRWQPRGIARADLRHPLSRSLVAGFSGGQVVQGLRGTEVVTVGSVTEGYAAYNGMGVKGSQHSKAAVNLKRIRIPNSTIGTSSTSGGTVFGVVTSVVAPFNGGHHFGIGSDQGTGGTTLFSVQSQSSPAYGAAIIGGSSTYVILTSTTIAHAVGVPHAIALTIDKFAAGATVRLYIDGVQVDSDTLNPGALHTFNWLIAAGFRRGGTDSAGDSDIVHALYAYERELSAAEIVALTENPWQHMEADDTPVFYSLGSSGASDITGSITESSDTVSGTIAAVHSLTGSIAESSDTVTGAVAAVHSIEGSITEPSDTVTGTVENIPPGISGSITESSDTVSGVVAALHSVTGSITESSDTVSGTVSVVDDAAYVTGDITEASDVVAGIIASVHSISGTITELSDTVSGTVSIAASIAGSITESPDTVSGTLDNPDAEVATKGGAGKAKIKKRKPLKNPEADPTMIELIQNLESEKIVKGQVVHETKQVVTQVPVIAPVVQDLTDLKQQLQELAPKESVQPEEVVIGFADVLSAVSKIDSKLDSVLKRIEQLEEVLIVLNSQNS